MGAVTYTYRFSETVSDRDIHDSLLMALLAVESLYGRTKVRMDCRFTLDRDTNTCIIEAGTKAGSDLASIFTGFVIKEFGRHMVEMERIRYTDRARTTSGGQGPECSGGVAC